MTVWAPKYQHISDAGVLAPELSGIGLKAIVFSVRNVLVFGSSKCPPLRGGRVDSVHPSPGNARSRCDPRHKIAVTNSLHTTKIN